jgi:threonine dehydratase
MLPSLETAASIVYRTLAPTPQRRWAMLDARCGASVWVKHEHELPTGSFKIRGGLVYFDHLATRGGVRHVVAATRGNHGQSVALAASRYRMKATIVVPHGNSEDKNRAMRALGAEVVEEGHDFQSALEAAAAMAAERGWTLVPSFDDLLVRGVASYSLELLRAVPDMDLLYVPIGLGSGICGAIQARDELNHPARIVGVVAAGAPAYARSLEQNVPVSCESTTRIADGLACRTPHPDALAMIRRSAERVVEVTDDEIEEAMRVVYDDMHAVAEGAAAAAFAALLRERDGNAGRTVGVVLTGSNLDRATFARVLAEP